MQDHARKLPPQGQYRRSSQAVLESQRDAARDARLKAFRRAGRTGTDIIDVPAYLERLRQLTEEALPEKMQRFIA